MRCLTLPFVLCLLLGLLVSACGQLGHSSDNAAAMPPDYSERFELSAGPGAADGYPATIDEARFITPSGSFPVPYGHFLNSGWGGSGTSWSVGDPMQAAPNILEIRWFSYTEDKFYEGRFLLPQERIYKLLKQGAWNTDTKKQETYDTFIVTVVPGGVVVVWLSMAGGNQVLLGRYEAREFSTTTPGTGRRWTGPATWPTPAPSSPPRCSARLPPTPSAARSGTPGSSATPGSSPLASPSPLRIMVLAI
jgi:hypothetical protein